MRKRVGLTTILLTVALCVTFFACSADVTVTEITLEGTPRTLCYVGEEYPLDGLKLQISYSDGTQKTLDVTREMVQGYDSSKEGSLEISFVFGEKAVTRTVQIVKKPATLISITATPTKTDYFINDSFDYSGSITLNYSDGTTVTEPITANLVRGVDLTTLTGEEGRTATITRLGRQSTFTYYVRENTSLAVEYVSPDEARFGKYGLQLYNNGVYVLTFIGDIGTFSTAVARCTIRGSYYREGDSLQLTPGEMNTAYFISDVEFNPMDYSYTPKLTANMNTVFGTLFDGGKTLLLDKFQFVDKELLKEEYGSVRLSWFSYPSSIPIGTTLSDFASYCSLTSFSTLSQLITEEDSGAFSISGFSAANVGETEFSVTSSGFTQTFSLSVYRKETDEVVRVEVSSLDQCSFLQYETIYLANYRTVVTYADGNTRIFSLNNSGLTISATDTATVGRHAFSITVGDATALGHYYVYANGTLPPIKSISLTGLQTGYIVGSNLDYSSLSAFVTYYGGQTQIIPLSEDNVTGFDSQKEGIVKLTVNVAGVELSKCIYVYAQQLITSIQLQQYGEEPLFVFRKGEAFSCENVFIVANSPSDEKLYVPLQESQVSGFSTAELPTFGGSSFYVTYAGYTIEVPFLLLSDEDYEKVQAVISAARETELKGYGASMYTVAEEAIRAHGRTCDCAANAPLSECERLAYAASAYEITICLVSGDLIMMPPSPPSTLQAVTSGSTHYTYVGNSSAIVYVNTNTNYSFGCFIYKFGNWYKYQSGAITQIDN